MQCEHLPTIHEFDQLLSQAINIADKHEALINEEGWFVILEFLSEYKQRVVQKLSQTVKDQAKLERIKDFLNSRKLHVLKMVPASVSLQSLTERLKLDFKQIKQLYDIKVKTVKNSEKFLKLSNIILEKELLDTSDFVFQIMVCHLY